MQRLIQLSQVDWNQAKTCKDECFSNTQDSTGTQLHVGVHISVRIKHSAQRGNKESHVLVK